ncbi:MAG: nitroreductase/quinone reductase family protein [Herbiconiux sp.]|nr:nitroreductase/quinone reductase family protein [Herbiconiux sp.]
MTDFNTQIIDEFRANGGHVSSYGFGDSLVLLHSVGARSGQQRISPLMAIAEASGSWLIAASKAGAPDNPAWYANLRAHPQTVVEAPDGRGGTEEVPVTAVVLAGAERDAAWEAFVAQSPGFADYQVKAGDRLIPVVRLERR